MNVYDTANKLAKEIKESKEYKQYKELKRKIEENPETKEQVEDFEKMRYSVQLKTLKGEETLEEKQILQKKYQNLLNNEEIKAYFEAEVKFNVIVADVNKIIAEAVKDVL